jgi:hypothetical protein
MQWIPLKYLQIVKKGEKSLNKRFNKPRNGKDSWSMHATVITQIFGCPQAHKSHSIQREFLSLMRSNVDLFVNIFKFCIFI